MYFQKNISWEDALELLGLDDTVLELGFNTKPIRCTEYAWCSL